MPTKYYELDRVRDAWLRQQAAEKFDGVPTKPYVPSGEFGANVEDIMAEEERRRGQENHAKPKSKSKPDAFEERERVINWSVIIGVIGGVGLLFVHWSLSIVFIAVLFGIAIFLRPEVDYAGEGDMNHKDVKSCFVILVIFVFLATWIITSVGGVR